jgi:hypothetical protein
MDQKSLDVNTEQSFLERRFWRVFISGVILVVDVLLLLGLGYCGGNFIS